MIDFARILQWLFEPCSHQYWDDEEDAKYYAKQLDEIAKAALITTTFKVVPTRFGHGFCIVKEST